MTEPRLAKPDPGRTDPVKTAARTLDVFEVFAVARRPLTLTELASRLDSPISSCHALVRTLQARGYVYILDERKRVYPTKRLLAMAQEIASNDPVLELIGPVLAALQQATGETVILGKRQGAAVIYLEVLEGRRTIRYAANAGDTKPLHSSAIGKAMLGALPGPELDRLVKRLALPSITPNTISTAAGLAADIEAGQARGWFMTRGENVLDVMAISVARSVGNEWYGLAVAGPLARVEASQAGIVEALLNTAERLHRIDLELHGRL